MRLAARLSNPWPGLVGPAAAAVFAVALVGFAARHEGYTHGTKAVSELGAAGAPDALAFNVFGFGLPGVLIIMLAMVLHVRLAGRRRAVLGPALLALSGLSLVLAGVFPVDMTRLQAPTSVAHFVAAQATGLAWTASLFWLGGRMRATSGFGWLGALSPWFSLFLLANVGWQVVWRATGTLEPGWGQRLAFAGFFLWAAIAGLRLIAIRTAANAHASGDPVST